MSVFTVDDRSFDELLSEKSISKAIALMTDNRDKVEQALNVYNIEKHSIMERKDRAVFGRKNPIDGSREFLRYDKRWKIPIPYPEYINEMALVFLYGRPVKWSQASEGTDNAFAAFTDIMQRTRLDAKLREAKRYAGAETQSALLFHTYRNEEGKADLLVKVLAKSAGDDIYFRKDKFGRLTSFAWGYNIRESGGKITYSLDIYTKEKIYNCTQVNMGWNVEEQANPVRKIPVILFEQETEFNGVAAMIDRREWMMSTLADVNDRFSSPTVVAIGDEVVSMPEKTEDSKSIHIKPSDSGKQADVKYLTWDSASESKKLEGEELDRQILNKTFTPNISYEQISGLSSMSGKALKQLMILATIKAERRKESNDEYISRLGSLLRAIIGNVLDIRLKAECENLKLVHEFQEPFGEDVQEMIEGLIKTYNVGGMSLDTFVELNPLIRDAEAEKKRLQEQREREMKEESVRMKMDVMYN
jgi:SPP1 family phage portal protein